MGVILRVIYCGHSRLAVMNDGVILRVIYLMNDGVILRVIYLMNDGLILRAIYCGHSRLSEMKDGAIFSVIYCGHIRLLRHFRQWKRDVPRILTCFNKTTTTTGVEMSEAVVISAMALKCKIDGAIHAMMSIYLSIYIYCQAPFRAL
ncbi:hypothetical protein DPMN_018404 [Dreissena polymorpha]|uniref:Uncharacterized protein n=1 Tax=Dreissena polymorpha TaxID=45954 RepID=A0A9D4ND51_DREPO|nr:hypothetical protein DPMN_018404 [Dreissena polymorpha]